MKLNIMPQFVSISIHQKGKTQEGGNVFQWKRRGSSATLEYTNSKVASWTHEE
jgi:hypothetical protein